jgi:hypothetical protein
MHTLSFVAQNIEEIFHQEKFQVKLLYIVVLLFCCECMVVRNTMTTGTMGGPALKHTKAARNFTKHCSFIPTAQMSTQ